MLVAKVKWHNIFYNKSYETIGFYETLEDITKAYKDTHTCVLKWIKIYEKQDYDTQTEPTVVAAMSFKGA